MFSYSHFPTAKFLVVFISEKEGIDEQYINTNRNLESEVEKIPGYLGMLSMHNEANQGITVIFWETKEAIDSWKKHQGHIQAKVEAKTKWYKNWSSYICEIGSNRSMN